MPGHSHGLGGPLTCDGGSRTVRDAVPRRVTPDTPSLKVHGRSDQGFENTPTNLDFALVHVLLRDWQSRI